MKMFPWYYIYSGVCRELKSSTTQECATRHQMAKQVVNKISWIYENYFNLETAMCIMIRNIFCLVKTVEKM